MSQTTLSPNKATRIEVTVGAKFDPAKHGATVLARIEEEYGEGFAIQSYDPDSHTVVAVRESSIAQFTADGDALHVELPDGTQESQGPKIAQEFENLKPGWKVTGFHPYAKPGFATMRELTDREVRVRDAVAQALRVQRTPWQVQIAERTDGGFDLELPKSYTSSKHDDALTEVAETTAGEPGWFVKIDPKTLRGAILPGQLPTFSTMIPYPFERDIPEFTAPSDTRWATVPLGRALGRPGEENGPEYCLNLKSASHTLLQGLPMSGKSVNINTFLYWMVRSGAELAIVDTPDKAVDFQWVKPYVRDGGWGCESYEAMVATCGTVYAEGKRRAKVLKQRGIANWFDVADDPSFRPLVLLADEYTGIMTKENVPKSLKRDHPMRVEAEETNGFKDMVGTFIQKTILEMRFVGVHVFISTQLGNNRTGVNTAVKAAAGNRFLMGPNASDNQRANAFNAPDSVAVVPDNVKNTAGVSKGVGVSETEGQPSTVFKGYFASVDEFRKRLEGASGLRRTTRPEPTAAEIAEYTGMEDDGQPTEQPSATSRRGDGPSTSEGMNVAREMGLQGAAAANFAGNYDQQKAAERAGA